MKKLIFIPIFLFLSCEENQPTQNIKVKTSIVLDLVLV